MLTRLAVRDLALFDDVALEFAGGLNVLTGETGAGKSLVVQALGLSLGARADRSTVRQGAERAVIEAVFEPDSTAEPGEHPAPLVERLRAAAIPLDDLCVLRRIVGRDGRSRAAINDQTVTLGLLREVGAILVDIHGQHAHQTLLDEERHTEVFDEVMELGARRRAVAAARREARAALEELEAFRARRARAEARRGELEERVHDIDALAPEPGELERLQLERQRARHWDRIERALARAEELLVEGEGAALERMGVVEGEFLQLSESDPFFATNAALLSELGERLRDLVREAESMRARAALAPAEVENLETRIDRLERLVRVHGGIEQALEAAAEARAQLAESDMPGLDEAKLAAVTATTATLEELARALSKARRSKARRFERRVSAELVDLGFPPAAFRIAFEPLGGTQVLDSVGDSGAEKVRFQMAPNPGEGERALSRIASGGELARLMLALRTALAGGGGADVLVFDEVDAAIGGAVLDAVAARLRALSRSRQVVCVTHEARIAAQADVHLHVRKAARGGRTVTEVVQLSDASREEELIRMLAGETPSPGARAHASDLLAKKHLTST